MAETKTQLLKEVKKVASEIGQMLQQDQFEEVSELVKKLKGLLESDSVNELTMAETRSIHYEELLDFVKKYKYWISEFRKSRGALRKKGEHLLEYVG